MPPRGDSIGSHVPEEYLTIKGLVELTGVSRLTIQRWCKAGHLPCHRMQRGSLKVKLFGPEHQAIALRLASSKQHRRPLSSR